MLASKRTFFFVLLVAFTTLNYANAEPKTSLKFYGFHHPEGYDPQNAEKYIHTKIEKSIKGEIKMTTGNWETDLNYALLPHQSTIPGGYKSFENVTKAEDEKEYEKAITILIKWIRYLKAWKNVYLHNFFNYDMPGTFSPHLPGYIWHVRQRSGYYGIIGKCFLYAAIVSIIMALMNYGYFSTPFPDENPRTLSNRVNDRYFNTDAVNRGKLKNGTTQCCLTFGMILCIFSCTIFMYSGNQNLKNFEEATRQLAVTIKGSQKSLTDLSKNLNNMNNENVVIPRALHRGETFMVENVMDELNAKFFKDSMLKAKSFRNNIINKSALNKPNKYMLFLIVIIFCFGMSIYAARRQKKGVNLISCLVMVLLGSYAIVNMGNIISDEYMFQEICSYFIYKDPRKAESSSAVIGNDEGQMATLGMTEYVHCFDLKFQERIREQIVNINTGQLALYKSCVFDIKEANAKMAKPEADKAAEEPISIPTNVKELIDLKKDIENQPDDLYYCIRHRNLIEKLQEWKKTVIRIPDCNNYGAFYNSARKNYCYYGLPNGIIMFYCSFGLFVGCLFLLGAYFRNEVMIKFTRDRKMQGASQNGRRYQNYSLTNLVKFTEMDTRCFKKEEHLCKENQADFIKKANDY